MKSRIILNLLLVVITMLGMGSVGFAETPLKENKVVINEYELIKELSLKSETELSSMGYSSNDITTIKDYHQVFVDHLNSLKQLDDSTLESLGYSSEQITTFKKFDESEEQVSILSASLNIYSSTANFRYVDTYSKGRLAYNWSWSGVPVYKLKDSVAVSWNDWVVENNSSYVSYYNVTTGSYYTQTTATFTTDGNGTEGAGHKFSVSLSDNLYYAKNGGGTFDVRSDVHAIKDFYYYIAYGHQRLWASISFSIGKGGADASISFNNGSVIADDETGSYIFN